MTNSASADPSTALPSQDAIVEAVGQWRDESVEMLTELVSHPSLLGQEASAQRVMKRRFAGLGLRVHEFAIDEARLKAHEGWSPSILPYDGRPNVVGIHEPKGPVRGRSLILNGHIDVVPVGATALWSRPPFEPRVEGDRLYGRGAADMKAGIVAYLSAFDALRRLGFEPAAKLVLQSVVEEECTGNGALACLVEGYTADAALIPEPMPMVMSAQMGVMWLAIEVLGVPVHAAYAHTGVAAIEFANHLVSRLRELEARWNLPAARHAMYANHEHPVNFNLGKISGGEWASSVPTQCRVDLRLGFYPGLKPAAVRQEVEAVLNEAWRSHPHHDSLRYEVVYNGFQAEGLVVDLQQPVITELSRAHQDITGAPVQHQAFTGTTDVKFFHLYGNIPATCYGPAGGDIHGIDEWVSIASMQQVTAVLALFIARWCGLNRL
ncbi:MAG: ArgE/DapE family deacylase [Ideonella sp.]|nr:ArgE/DapE family deacylase [Ideonella sp.]